MKNLIALGVLTALSFPGQAFPQARPDGSYSLDALQGAWWTNCEAPAAEFVISGNEYSGDFEGAFEVMLDGDALVFSEGFADGHSVSVTHEALSYEIQELSERRLVLRPLAGTGEDWYLQSCDDTP